MAGRAPLRSRPLRARGRGNGEEPLATLAQLVLDDWAKRRSEPRWRLRLPDDTKGLHQRWLDDAGRERAEGVRRALATGRLEEMAFGVHQGRLDLRGFVDPDIERSQRWWSSFQGGSGQVDHPAGIDAGSLDGVDFSGARFDALSFDRKSVANSRFDGVDFRDIRLRATTVTDTTFRGSRFGELPILDGTSGWLRRRRCAFRRVDFTDADLSGVYIEGAQLEECDFSGARLAKAMFASTLIRCRFAGHLHDVTFIGRPGLSGRRPRLQRRRPVRGRAPLCSVQRRRSHHLPSARQSRHSSRHELALRSRPPAGRVPREAGRPDTPQRSAGDHRRARRYAEGRCHGGRAWDDPRGLHSRRGGPAGAAAR